MPDLVTTMLYDLGFRGYRVNDVECILPPVCLVPAGAFLMGSDKSHDEEAFDDETPWHMVMVDDFAIGQFPVTVAEYACAVRAKAVREPPEDDGLDWQMQQDHPDHPVVCISWIDALTYVRWLAKTTEQAWRLPTEAEWEKAARGTDGRVYPWGYTFDQARCNSWESRFEATTPVWRYPCSASPYHTQDMAGNVFERTSTLHQPYPYRPGDGREDLEAVGDRVARGGSWLTWGNEVRVAWRIGLRTDTETYADGFRLALGDPDSA